MSAPPPPLPQHKDISTALFFPSPCPILPSPLFLCCLPPLPFLLFQTKNSLSLSLSLSLSRDSCGLEKGGGKRKAKQDGGGRGERRSRPPPQERRERGGKGAANTTHMHGGKWEGRFVTLVLVRPSEASGGCRPPSPPFSAAGKATTATTFKGERGGEGEGGEPPLERARKSSRSSEEGPSPPSFSVRPSVFGSGIEAAKGGGEERRGPQLERRASSGRDSPFSSACQHPHLKEGRRKTLLDFPPFPLLTPKLCKSTDYKIAEETSSPPRNQS